MRKLFSFLMVASLLLASSPVLAKVAPPWQATTPAGYTAMNWVKERGVSSFMKAPTGNGYLDYLTFIYLPYSQINFISSSTPPVSWGPAKAPFDEIDPALSTTTLQDWAVPKMVAEQMKIDNPNVKFLWNVPFFNITVPTTDLSLGLKNTSASGTYITSGSRPDSDMAQARKMLIINNEKFTGQISDFDENAFVSTSTGDQAVEGFSPFTFKSDGNGGATARLFLGIKNDGKELVVYCSQSATVSEASQALLDAGVPVENQMQADGGGSATCAYNLPGQYFVSPGRTLPYLMGATPILYRATVTIKDLNVRNAANAKGAVVRRLAKGVTVTIFQEKNGWARISEKQEWVSVSLLKKM
ncbi:MAG: SH3 domain-containing protein [Candidatus Magasanikbacteria bacterium]|nr:SH3 domain-containing protein [Candidatus Magasanikbacteria bacterium]